MTRFLRCLNAPASSGELATFLSFAFGLVVAFTVPPWSDGAVAITNETGSIVLGCGPSQILLSASGAWNVLRIGGLPRRRSVAVTALSVAVVPLVVLAVAVSLPSDVWLVPYLGPVLVALGVMVVAFSSRVLVAKNSRRAAPDVSPPLRRGDEYLYVTASSVAAACWATVLGESLPGVVAFAAYAVLTARQCIGDLKGCLPVSPDPLLVDEFMGLTEVEIVLRAVLFPAGALTTAYRLAGSGGTEGIDGRTILTVSVIVLFVGLRTLGEAFAFKRRKIVADLELGGGR